jgi:hypothetical protein
MLAFNAFIAGKSESAAITFPAAAYGVPGRQGTGINHLII